MVIQASYTKTRNVTEKLGCALRLILPNIVQSIHVYKDIAPLVYVLMKTTYPSVFKRGFKGNSNYHPYYMHLFVVDRDFLSPYTIYYHQIFEYKALQDCTRNI